MHWACIPKWAAFKKYLAHLPSPTKVLTEMISPSLRSNLNLAQSAAKILKSSKFIVLLPCNTRSDIANCLTFLKCFSVRLEIFMYSATLMQKVTEGFSVTSNLVVTTRLAINYSRAGFFLKWIFETKQDVQLTLRFKKQPSVYNMVN